jgi:YVTN family beta-propeller protein
VYQGNGQTGQAQHALADSLYVMVRDSIGNPVGNATVSFAVTSGGGSVSPATVQTRVDGRAATSWTLGSYGDPQNVTATVQGVGDVQFFASVEVVPEGTSVTLGQRPFGLGISSADVIYVGQLDNGTVARFEGTTKVTSIPVGSGPVDVVFNAAGTRAYVSNQLSQSVYGIDVATNTVDDTIRVTGNPFRVLLSPDESRIYVLTDANKVFAYDVSTGTESGHLDLSATPNGVAVTSDGTRLYVSTHSGGTVVEVNTSNMTALRTFTPGGTVQEVLLSPDGAELYVVSESSMFFVYDLASGNPRASVSLGSGAGGFGAAMTPSPDRSKIYITMNFVGDIKVFDRGTRTVVRTIHVGGAPRRIKFTSDGTAVIANEAGYVTWVK